MGDNCIRILWFLFRQLLGPLCMEQCDFGISVLHVMFAYSSFHNSRVIISYANRSKAQMKQRAYVVCKGIKLVAFCRLTASERQGYPAHSLLGDLLRTTSAGFISGPLRYCLFGVIFWWQWRVAICTGCLVSSQALGLCLFLPAPYSRVCANCVLFVCSGESEVCL